MTLIELEPASTISYWLHSRVVGTITRTDLITVSGARGSIELSVELFQMLMLFAEKTTIAQAFQSIDVDIDIDEFTTIIEQLFEGGFLNRDQTDDEAPSLQQWIDPALSSDPGALDLMRAWMREGRAIVIPDAMPAAFAEQVHGDLDRATHWQVLEGGHDFFHYRACGLTPLEERTTALSQCSRLFKSATTRRFMTELSGRDCAGEAAAAAAWYRPGEYALPHDDCSSDSARSVAFIWYLTKGWRQEWGGALYWCPTGQYVMPGFNTLMIFNVMPSNVHLVCPVATGATAKRLTVNGFWQRTERGSRSSLVSPERVISPRAYGRREVSAEQLPAVTVL